MNLIITGIQCDNPKCDFKKENISFEEYPQWLNKPCPICGENLLTDEDYNTVKMMVSITAMANKIISNE